ncbi:hypothetical protein UlMin_021950 [Ulmus minor]
MSSLKVHKVAPNNAFSDDYKIGRKYSNTTLPICFERKYELNHDEIGGRREGNGIQYFADNHKRKFAEQEFNAIKKRRKLQHMQKCSWIVTPKNKEAKNVKRTVLKSVVGTLELSIRYLERVKAPLFRSINRISQNRYGYIANVCVAKSARRQGIAHNMLHFAVEIAISDKKFNGLYSHITGVEQVYVHVHRHNNGAQELYRKLGFEDNKRDLGYSDKIVRGQITTQQNLLEEETLHPSDDGVNYGD